MPLILKAEIRAHFQAPDYFNQIMALQGEVYRQLEGRCTQRITLGEKNYFVKHHTGIGWKEIFKNLFQWRLPIFGAKNEWCAIQRLHALGIPTLEILGYGCQGINPARLRSFLLTRELPDHSSLEDFCKDWKTHPPTFRLKQQLIKQVALIARTLHNNGINHRDFYICHFLLAMPLNPDQPKLYLIDLHRAAVRSRTGERWIIKDLAGLYFSSKNIGLTKRDILRFIKEYRKKELRFWLKVEKRGEKLYRKHAT